MAANPLAAQIAGDLGVEISWGGWALAALVPGLVSLGVVPWMIYKLYPPEIKETPAAVQIARDELARMGKLKTSEWYMLGTFFLLLILWILGERYPAGEGSLEHAGVVLGFGDDGHLPE
jgi:DASS family divalent anion:Na+ symporter